MLGQDEIKTGQETSEDKKRGQENLSDWTKNMTGKGVQCSIGLIEMRIFHCQLCISKG